MIRPARASDIRAVLAIERLCHPNPWTEAHFVAELENARTLFLVIDEGELHGYVVAWRVAGELQIQNVTTAPAARRKGHARTLLDQVLVQAADCPLCTLEVSEHNAAALALYTTFGFVTVGRRAGYYSNGDAALLMEKRLMEKRTTSQC